MIKGTLGNELEVKDGYRAARACAIGLISTIKGSYGSGLMFFFFSAAEAVDFRDVTQTKCITSRCSILYIWRTVSRSKSPGSHSCSIQLPLGQVGELCKVKRIVKLNVMVQSANGFEEQPEVRHTWLCVFPTYQKQLIACFKGG